MDVQELIRKYYAGESSLHEEKELMTWFSQQTGGDQNRAEHDQFLYFMKMQNESPSSVFTNESDLFPRDRSASSFKWKVIALAAALMIFSFCGWFYLKPGTETTHLDSSIINNVVITEATQKNFRLPDGSLVWLNSSSRIEFPETFSAKQREVFLEGEAYFEIQEDRKRPFIIHTGQVTTEVVGTSFNLRSYQSEATIELDVITGNVFFGAGEKQSVSEGRHATCISSGQVSIGEKPNRNAMSWKTRDLVFEDAPIREVIKDMERFFNQSVIVENPDVLDCHFHGKFHAPRIDDVLKVIGYSLNTEYVFVKDQYILKGSGCQSK